MAKVYLIKSYQDTYELATKYFHCTINGYVFTAPLCILSFRPIVKNDKGLFMSPVVVYQTATTCPYHSYSEMIKRNAIYILERSGMYENGEYYIAGNTVAKCDYNKNLFYARSMEYFGNVGEYCLKTYSIDNVSDYEIDLHNKRIVTRNNYKYSIRNDIRNDR